MRTPSDVAGELCAAVRRQAKALGQAERARRMKVYHEERAGTAYLEAAVLAQELVDALALNISNREWLRMQEPDPKHDPFAHAEVVHARILAGELG